MFLDKWYNSSLKEDIEGFIHGNCEFLAYELNKKYGYKVEVVVRLYNIEELSDELDLKSFINMSYDEYQDYFREWFDNYTYPEAEIIHCYNTFEKEGVKYYVDARGATSDEEEFFELYDIEGIVAYLEFDSGDDLRNRHFSTYYDGYGNKNFEEETLKYRIEPAIKYVSENKNLFTII